MRPDASPERGKVCRKYDHADYRGLVAAALRTRIRTSSAAVVRPAPGWLRQWFQPSFSSSERAAWRAVLRRPGVAAWTLLFAILGLGLSAGSLQRRAAIFRDGTDFENRVQSTLDDVLRVVGPGVTIRKLEIADLDRHVAATYTNNRYWITVNRRLQHFPDEDVLETMAHEVVHAMFDQGRLRHFENAPDFSVFVLSEEVAADILGAHIAGRVRSAAGGDGAALTDRLVRRHRNRSDPNHPASFYQRFDRALASFGPDAVDPKFELSISIHFGSPERVDEVDGICRRCPDPWDAANEISQRYLTWNEPETRRERLARLVEGS